MKYILLSIVAFSTITISSCGSEETKELTLEEKMCECMGVLSEMKSEMKEVLDDPEKIQIIQDKYEQRGKDCEIVSNKMEETLKEGQDKKSKMIEMSESCPAIKEALGM